MVVIALPSPLVSILVSMTSCITELFLLKSLRNIISLREYALLQNGHLLFLKAHVRRVRFAQILPLVSFIVLEVVFSSFSSPTTIMSKREEDCVSLRLSVNTNFSEHVFTEKARHVFASCVQVSANNAAVFLANMSLTSAKVVCSDSASYRFKFDEEKLLGTLGATRGCSTFGLEPSCAWVKKEGSDLWMSDQGDGASLFDEEAVFTRTELLFEVNDNLLPFLSKRMAANENSNSYFFRKNVLLDSVEDVCEFEYEQKQGTNVPTPIAVLLLTIWLISISLLCFTCFVRGKGLYDVANARQVLSRTVRMDDDQTYPIRNAAVLKRKGRGKEAQYVLCSADDGDSMNKI